MKTANNTDDYLKKIRPELRKYTLNLLEKVGGSYETAWVKNIDNCIRSCSLSSEIDDYLRAIKGILKNEEYSHFISDRALKKIDKISKNFKFKYNRQNNSLYHTKTQEFEPFDGLEIDVADYNDSGIIKNIIHYHYESNEKTKRGIFFLEECELIDPIEKNTIYYRGKTRDSTLFLGDDELNELLGCIEAHNNKMDILKYYQELIESNKSEGKQQQRILNTSDKEILKYIEFDGIIPKHTLTPQNHTQMIDEEIIKYENGYLIFTDFGYNLFQKMNELYEDI